MADWLKSMQQTYEFYTVDPNTWKDVRQLDNVVTCAIERDSEAETLGSASIDMTESVDECYVRVYLVTIQNGVEDRHPLGTFLVQTPSTSFDGKIKSATMDAYTPLLELKEKKLPIGYYVPKYTDALEISSKLVKEYARAPVVTGSRPLTWRRDSSNKDICKNDINFYPANTWTTPELQKLHLGDLLYDVVEDKNKVKFYIWTYSNQKYLWAEADNIDDMRLYSNFVADEDATVLEFVSDLLASAKYKLSLDEMGRILFAPDQETESLQPIWTYNDDNSSILYPEIDMEHDIYGIPNVVEVIYSDGKHYYHSTVVNDDPNSPLSTVNRGREIIYRETNPDVFVGVPSDEQVKEYAKKLLKELSTIEYSVTYTHGYCPVRLGDCVRLNYTRAGLRDVKAKVVSQSIECSPGCPVTEKAIFVKTLFSFKEET